MDKETFERMRQCYTDCMIYFGDFPQSHRETMLNEVKSMNAAELSQEFKGLLEDSEDFPEIKPIISRHGFNV